MRGYLQKRGKKWSFVIDIGRDGYGSRKQKRFSGFDTKKEAQQAMTEKINEVNQGTYIEPSKETFGDYVEKWFATRKKNLRPSSFNTYKYLIQKHIIPQLGKIPLADLNTFHIETFYDRLQSGERNSKPLAASTIRKIHQVINPALQKAATKYKLIQENPAKEVELPKLEEKEMDYYTEEEARYLLNNTRKNTRVHILFMLALSTGMRRGEILGLKWDDIDWKNKTLYVRRQLTTSNEFVDVKTKAARRSISLDDHTLEELKAHKSKQNEERLENGPAYQNKENLIICTEIGSRYHPDNVKRTWNRLFNRKDMEEIRKIRFHDLRHTHATLLLKQGVHVKIVSERLGHSSVRTTLDKYSHVIPGLQEAAAQQFGNALFGTENNQKSTLA